jgi:transcriptional regulator with XRE-family HTH domain
MTDLRQLIAFNLKQKRQESGLTQAALAEKAGTSTQYIAMIELGRKFPSLDMIERLAAAFGVDILEFFAPIPIAAGSLEKLQKTFLKDMEKEVLKLVNKAVLQAIKNVVGSYTMELEKGD